MFSAMGKKRLLLKIKRAKSAGIQNPLELFQGEVQRYSPSKSRSNSPSRSRSSSISPGRSRRSRHRRSSSLAQSDAGFSASASVDSKLTGASGTENAQEKNISSVASKKNLSRLLKSRDCLGDAIRKLMAATINYRPERDSIVTT